MRILTIDDEAEVLLYLKEMLEAEGFEVCAASTVQEGLEQTDRSFNVIITDLSLHTLDGKDYIEIMKVRYPSLPIIVLSGHVSSEEELIELGVSKILTKPVNIQSLVAAIKEVATD